MSCSNATLDAVAVVLIVTLRMCHCIVVDVKSSLELSCEIVRGFDVSSKKKAMTDLYVRCP